MKTKTRARKPKRLTAIELLKLPPAKRDRILRAAAKKAEREYRSNPALTAYEAFGPDDLHGESANTKAR